MRLGSFILALLAPFVTSSAGFDGGLAAHHQPGSDALAHSILTLWRVIGPLAVGVDAAAQTVSLHPVNTAASYVAQAQPAPDHLVLTLPPAHEQAALRPLLPLNQKLLLRC